MPRSKSVTTISYLSNIFLAVLEHCYGAYMVTSRHFSEYRENILDFGPGCSPNPSFVRVGNDKKLFSSFRSSPVSSSVLNSKRSKFDSQTLRMRLRLRFPEYSKTSGTTPSCSASVRPMDRRVFIFFFRFAGP